MGAFPSYDTVPYAGELEGPYIKRSGSEMGDALFSLGCWQQPVTIEH